MIDGSGSSRQCPASPRLRCSDLRWDLKRICFLPIWRLKRILDFVFGMLRLTFVGSVGAIEDDVWDERLADASRAAARAFKFPRLTICNRPKGIICHFRNFFLKILLLLLLASFIFSSARKTQSEAKWRMRRWLVGGAGSYKIKSCRFCFSVPFAKWVASLGLTK